MWQSSAIMVIGGAMIGWNAAEMWKHGPNFDRVTACFMGLCLGYLGIAA